MICGLWTDRVGATTAQAQRTTASSNVTGEDGKDVGGRECPVINAAWRHQVEVVRQLEDGEIAGEDGIKGTLVGAIEPSSPMHTDVRVPELDRMEPSSTSVSLLGLSKGPKEGGSRQVAWSEATRTIPPPGIPDNAGTGSSQPTWEDAVKEEEEKLPDVQTQVPEMELPAATIGSSQPMPNGVIEEGPTLPEVQTQVPKRPPAEVDVLARAYTSGFPVILVAKRSVIHKKWSNLRVPEECEYVYLGCFSVQGVQVRFILRCAMVWFLTNVWWDC